MSLYTKGGKLMVYPKLTSLKHWRPRFFSVNVPSDFPLHLQWTKPRPRMEHIHDRGLTPREKEVIHFFEASSIPTLKGEEEGVGSAHLATSCQIRSKQPDTLCASF